MPVRSCIICGGREYQDFLVVQGISDNNYYKLQRCSSCGLVVSEDQQSGRDLPYNILAHNNKGFLGRMESLYITFRWMREVRFLKRFLEPDATVLDIGCGDGAFIKECLKNNISAEGIDHTELSLDPELKGRIFRIDINSEDLPKRKYDALTFYHSLEHLEDPSRALEKARAILKEGGLLFVQLPNIDSLQFWAFKLRWFHLFMPFHKFHFSRDTLKRLVEKKGFQVISIRHFSNRWNPEGWSASILRWNPVYFLMEGAKERNHPAKKLFYLLLTLIFIPISLLESVFKKGGVITLVARKLD